MRKIIRLTLLALALTVGTAWTQDVTGNLEGRVLNLKGEALPGVNVTVNGSSLQGVRGAASDERGAFRILALPVGSYTVKVSHTAYQGVTYENVSVRLGKTTTLGEVQLQARTVGLPEVVVNGEKPLLDPTSTTLGVNLRAEVLAALPLQRDYASAAVLAPQANAGSHPDDGVNVGGASGWDNTFYIDGIHVTNPALGNEGTALPYNFIQEIEVKTGGYQAEFGRALGGIVNVVTRTGSNKFEGQIFGYLTNSGLAGEKLGTPGGTHIQSFTTYDLGFRFGGPLAKDRLWFYAAYNPQVETRDAELVTLGVHEDKATTHRFAGKLTYQAGPNTSFTFTSIGDPTTRNSVGSTYVGQLPDPTRILDLTTSLGRLRRGGLRFSARGRHAVSPRLLLEASASRLRVDSEDKPRESAGMLKPFYGDFVEGVWSGGYGRLRDNVHRRTAGDAVATFSSRRHTFKAGIQLERNEEDWFFSNRLTGSTRQDPSVLLRLSPDYYIGVYSNWKGIAGNRVWSLFGQDAWQVTDRLLLNLGLRWDAQSFYAEGETFQTIARQGQPRVGLVYQPGEPGSQKIFASFGRFYQQVGTDFIVGFIPGTYITYEYTQNPLVNPVPADTAGTTLGFQNRNVPGLNGPYQDEFTFGYERTFAHQMKVGIQGTRRDLKEAIDVVIDQTTRQQIWGNPGRGDLASSPRPKRTYTALELTMEKAARGRYQVSASYVWSRTRGNLTGAFGDENVGFPNYGGLFPERSQNLDGPLPNDRPHLFKAYGSYRMGGVSVGSFFTIQSGTPLSELGLGVFEQQTFHLSPRGSKGRTPATWDCNLRFTYDLPRLIRTGEPKARLIADLYHLFSRRRPTVIDQTHYFGIDKDRNPIAENPAYLKPIYYQDPMSARLGIEVDFWPLGSAVVFCQTYFDKFC